MYFCNTSFFLSVEAQTKYFYPLLSSSMYLSKLLLKIRQRDFSESVPTRVTYLMLQITSLVLTTDILLILNKSESKFLILIMSLKN